MSSATVVMLACVACHDRRSELTRQVEALLDRGDWFEAAKLCSATHGAGPADVDWIEARLESCPAWNFDAWSKLDAPGQQLWRDRVVRRLDPARWSLVSEEDGGSLSLPLVSDRLSGHLFRFVPGGRHDFLRGYTEGYEDLETRTSVWEWSFLISTTEFVDAEAEPEPNGTTGLPAEVDWVDAVRLSRRFGLSLPSESQYSHIGAACDAVAGSAERLYPRAQAWFEDNSSGLQPVATCAADELGLYDVGGNLWEWCVDAGDGPHLNGLVNPVRVGEPARRIVRGGAWVNLRSGRLMWAALNQSGDAHVTGFRLSDRYLKLASPQ